MIAKGRLWKIAGVILLIYVILAGMLVPLKPGIEEVSPSSGKSGEMLHLEVTGYNVHFLQEASSLRAWLKWPDGRALRASGVQVLSDRQVRLDFSIPSQLPEGPEVQAVTLLVDHPSDGTAVLPTAIFLTQEEGGENLDTGVWEKPANFSKGPFFTFPYRNILAETVRNTYFHVPLWFGMMFLFLAAVIHSVRHLRSGGRHSDQKAVAYTLTGILFGVLGLLTGAVWAKHTWGAYWSWDIKQNMTAVALLIYVAYFILRASVDDPDRKGRVGAAYGIFAFSTLIPLLYVIPRLTDSLHPGSGGNPAFGSQDLDHTMRLVFYPAIIGWTLLGFWMASLWYRYLNLREKVEDFS